MNDQLRDELSSIHRYLERIHLLAMSIELEHSVQGIQVELWALQHFLRDWNYKDGLRQLSNQSMQLHRLPNPKKLKQLRRQVRNLHRLLKLMHERFKHLERRSWNREEQQVDYDFDAARQQRSLYKEIIDLLEDLIKFAESVEMILAYAKLRRDADA